MPFIPNEADAAFGTQAAPDSQDFEALRAGSDATGVVSGCAVTAQGTPDMTAAVAAGVVAVAGAKANVAAGNVTLTADGTNPRNSIIVVSSTGTKSAVNGTPTALPDDPPFPAIPANSVLLAGVHVPAADTDIDANQITDKRVFVIPPEPTTNYDLAKARDIPLVKERSQTVTLDTGEFQIHCTVIAKGRLFGVCLVSPSKFVRFNNLDDLTDRTVITFPSDGFHDGGCCVVYSPEKDRLYVLFQHASRTTIAEVNLDTLATTDVISDTTHVVGDATNGGAITLSSTHLFVVSTASPSKVFKYQLSDFAFVAEATLTGLDVGHSAMYDGDSVYAGGNVSPGWVAKINPTDLTFTSVMLSVGFVTHLSFASDGDSLFVGTEGVTGPWLWRMNKATLALEPFALDGPAVGGIYHDGDWVWAALPSSPGKLARINPHNGETAMHTFASGENHPYSMTSDGRRLFIVFWLPNPAMVKRLVPPALPSVRLGADVQVGIGTSLTTGKLIAVHNVQHVVGGNVGTGEDTLLSVNLTANTLSTDKKALRITASGRFAANATAKRVILKFGLGAPVVVFDTGSLLFNDVQWWLEAICVRTAANAQDWVTKWTCDSSLLATDVQHSTSTQTDTSAINILVRGVGAADNDVTCEFLLVEMMN